MNELTVVQRRTRVPDVKIRALIELFGLILFTEPNESQHLLNTMRGRRGKHQPLTYGEILGLADGNKINIAANQAGIPDLGSSSVVDLAKALEAVAQPNLPLCDACHRFPVHVDGGVLIVLNKLDEPCRCPFKGCNGLLTPPKQAQPYRSWTTLKLVPAHITHDRDSIPHQPLPLKNEDILRGKDWFIPSMALRDACAQENLLTQDGDPDLVHLCMYLVHGSGIWFRGKDEVLTALEDNARLSCHDRTSLRALVRKAKSWQLPEESTVENNKPVTSVRKNIPRYQRPLLAEFLSSAFDISELHRFVLYKYGRGLSNQLNRNDSLWNFSNSVANLLGARGLIDAQLEQHLLDERPGRANEIKELFRMLL